MKLSLQLQRRRPHRPGPGISLFPFLAVLICTMGALVPLLLVISRTARLQAEAAAAAKAVEQAAQLSSKAKTQVEDAKWRIEQLKLSRRQTEAQLADARLELGHFEEHSRRLRGQIARDEDAMANLDRLEQTDGRQTAQAAAELQEVRGQLDTAKRQLDQARRTSAGRARCYAVVPYEGPNQTRRRPIYIECLADAVVLQPEGVRLTEADFEGPLGPGNPLAAALRAAREYMLAGHDFDPQAGEPYPMLLVRPEGITAYYAARAAMKSWGGDFGYELIGDDWKLAFQPPDPRLADIFRQVIAVGRDSEARLAAAAPRQYGRGHSRRSAEPTETTEGARDEQGLIASGSGDGRGLGTSAPNGPEGLGTSAPNGPGGLGTSAPNGPEGLGTSVPSGIGQTAGGQGPSGTGGAIAGSPLRPAEGWGDGAPGNPYRPAGQGPGGVPGGSMTGPSLAGGPRTSSVGNPEAAITGATASGDQPADSIGRGNGTNAAPAAPGGRYGAPAGNSAGASPKGDGPSDRPEGYIAGQPPREREPDPLARRQPADDPPDGVVRGQALRPGEWEPTPDLPDRPEKKDKDDRADRKHKKSTVDHHGEDWALRNAGRGIGITRPIRIECYADRLVVISDRGPADNRVIPLGRSTATSIDTFVSAIWSQMDAWGMAGRGMYWRPVLQVSVAPDAQQRYADLSALLNGSGLTVERR